MTGLWHTYSLTLASIVRDRSVLLLILIGPVLYSFYYPFPYSQQVVRDMPMGVADLDQSTLSRKMVRLADASPDLEITFVANDTAHLRRSMWAGEIQGGLIIPRGFRGDLLRGKGSNLVVLGNGAYFLFNRAELLGVTGAAQALSGELELKRELATSVSPHQAIERSQPVRLELRATSNPTGGYSTYLVPAVAVVILQQTLLLGICMLLGTWRESGAPFDLGLRRNRIAVVLAAATLCFVNALYYVGVVYWREDYPHLGRLQDLVPVIAVFSLATGAWVVAIGSWMRYREQAVIHLLPTAIPIIFLAGFAWPIESIPVPLRALGTLVPSTAGIQSFIKVDQMGADLEQVVPELRNLLCLLGAALLMIVLRKRWPLSG